VTSTGFTCSCCGEYHADLARAIPVKMPTALARIPQAERSILWSEQHDGISLQRVQEVMEWFLHGRFKQVSR
jgi:hypothetical protein